MASETDICNLALARLGDDATVSNLHPPEGSAQAQHCARFYPMARDAMLELHPWSFATKRVSLAKLYDGTPDWRYVYMCPNDVLYVQAIRGQSAYDTNGMPIDGKSGAAGSDYHNQNYVRELDAKGQNVILSNEDNAVMIYTARITETVRFPPLFVESLSWLLASHLAGPLIKGDAGAGASKSAYQAHRVLLSQAVASDANQRRIETPHHVGWMDSRTGSGNVTTPWRR
jgi:hypothetical protein